MTAARLSDRSSRSNVLIPAQLDRLPRRVQARTSESRRHPNGVRLYAGGAGVPETSADGSLRFRDVSTVRTT